MRFSASEVRYLSGSFGRGEVRNGPLDGWPPIPPDMPAHLFQRCLEARAKKLGNTFVEFRARNQALQNEVVDSLEQRIAATKLL